MIVAACIKLAKREAVLCLSVVVSPVESNQVTHYALGDTLYLESQPCYHALANTQKPLVSHKIRQSQIWTSFIP